MSSSRVVTFRRGVISTVTLEANGTEVKHHPGSPKAAKTTGPEAHASSDRSESLSDSDSDSDSDASLSRIAAAAAAAASARRASASAAARTPPRRSAANLISVATLATRALERGRAPEVVRRGDGRFGQGGPARVLLH